MIGQFQVRKYSCVFLPCFHGLRASRLGHKRKEKNSVHNLPYGPRTRLVSGINTRYKEFLPMINFRRTKNFVLTFESCVLKKGVFKNNATYLQELHIFWGGSRILVERGRGVNMILRDSNDSFFLKKSYAFVKI